ncbi:MAG TPA: FeS assembly SUF system protein, partial [Cytophagales bacterium]|nr:FeS assembly SUF system protein [Cytophagales bacterium]
MSEETQPIEPATEIPQGDLRDKVIAAIKTVYDPEIP